MAQNQNTTKSMAFFYPVISYFLVIAIMNQMILPLLPFDAVVCQGLTSLAAAVVIYLLFIYREQKGDGADREASRVCLMPLHADTCRGILLAIVWLACAGIAMNNLIAMSGLQQISNSYQQVEQAFYSSDILREILALGIVTPFAEELLYRYVVFRRLRESYGAGSAVLGSTLVFAVLHMNVVQIIYAFVLGLLLALLMEVYQDMRVPFLGHVTANIIAILRGETRFLSWMQIGEPLFLPATVILSLVTVLIAGYYIKTCKNNE